MVKITFIEENGEEQVIQAQPGKSLMENAVENGVRGIAADCGGVCACATCRVYVREDWRARTGEPSEMEQSMIEYAEDTSPRVRLSCQIEVTTDLDGLVVDLPDSQY